MVAFSNLGIILCCIVGVVLLGLVAELYYVFWWKRKLNTTTKIEEQHIENNYATNLFSLSICCEKPISTINSDSTEELNSTAEPKRNEKEKEEEEEEDLELGNSRDKLSKGLVEESVESELIRLHNLCGPPRFLFTIKEETKEDLLECEDTARSRKGSSGRSLSDLLLAESSPPIKKVAPLEAFNGFNPHFESLRDNHKSNNAQVLFSVGEVGSESLTEREFNKLRSTPPPKFKFMRDAEEKLIKRLVKEAENRALQNGGFLQDSLEANDGSFISLLNVSKQRETEISQQQAPIQNSGPSKVLSLATSPSTLRPFGLRKEIVASNRSS